MFLFKLGLVCIAICSVLIVVMWIFIGITTLYERVFPPKPHVLAARARAEAERLRLSRIADEVRKREDAKRQREIEEAGFARLQAEQAQTAARQAAEQARVRRRDADAQDESYVYEIGRHGNEALAMRYGIANLEKKTKEFWFYKKGGEKVRNKDRDTIIFEPASTIRLRKIRKVSANRYEVLLCDFRDRKAVAAIEPGTEVVRTFYPLDEDWFRKNRAFEEAVKGGQTFTLKELAMLHVEKTVHPGG
jgi:hypothetical protein